MTSYLLVFLRRKNVHPAPRLGTTVALILNGYTGPIELIANSTAHFSGRFLRYLR